MTVGKVGCIPLWIMWTGSPHAVKHSSLDLKVKITESVSSVITGQFWGRKMKNYGHYNQLLDKITKVLWENYVTVRIYPFGHQTPMI